MTLRTPSALRHRRRECDLTIAQLAERVGVSPRQVVRYETGEQIPSVRVAQRIADVLGAPIDAVFPHPADDAA
jgi:transcriptional regulator with XRE-family HTH domain